MGMLEEWEKEWRNEKPNLWVKEEVEEEEEEEEKTVHPEEIYEHVFSCLVMLWVNHNTTKHPYFHRMGREATLCALFLICLNRY